MHSKAYFVSKIVYLVSSRQNCEKSRNFELEAQTLSPATALCTRIFEFLLYDDFKYDFGTVLYGTRYAIHRFIASEWAYFYR